VTITQRYFIPSFFPIGIMIGYTIDTLIRIIFERRKPGKSVRSDSDPNDAAETVDLSADQYKENIGLNKILNITTGIASLVFIIFFTIFMITYYKFIEEFDYPNQGFYGWLSPDSGPPYASQYDAMMYALAEAKKDGFDSIVISYDWNIRDKLNMSGTEEYIWKYVLKRSLNYSPSLPYYFISPLDPPQQIPQNEIKRFGAFKVYKKKDSISSSRDQTAAIIPLKVFSLISIGSGKCLDIANASIKGGSRLIQWDFHEQTNQRFHFAASDEPDYYYIQTELTLKFVEMHSDHSVTIEERNGAATQKWKVVAVDSMIRIESRKSGETLAVDKGSSDSGAAIATEPLSKTEEKKNQLWKIIYY